MNVKDAPLTSPLSPPPKGATSDVRTIVLGEIRSVALEQKKTVGALEDSAPLLSLGLDSLGLAVLVVRLEELLGIDPFGREDEVDFPVTLGDLIRIYQVAASKG